MVAGFTNPKNQLNKKGRSYVKYQSFSSSRHIGNDLYLKTTESGVSYCRFNVSTKTEKSAAVSGVNWHRCLVTGELAEQLVGNCEKGTNIYMTGSVVSRFTDNASGLKKEITELVVADFDIVSGEREAEINVKAYLDDVREEMKKEEDHTPF